MTVCTLRRSMAAVAVLLAHVSGGAVAQGLPGGATSLNETHGDWMVACRTIETQVRCAITQTQVRGENRQRVLAVELTADADGTAARGVLVLPFGLQLASGARLSLDQAGPRDTLAFSTCLPAGCLVPLEFDAATVTAMKSAPALTVGVTAIDSGKDMDFAISLAGFASAFERVAQLGAP